MITWFEVMITWLETFGKTHLFYIILIVGGVFGFRCWLVEHDARVQADNTVKQSVAQVQSLQAQIAARDTKNNKHVQTITKVVHDAVTPSQVVQAIPQLTGVTLNARLVPGTEQIAVDASPLLTLMGDYATDKSNLQTCQADLADTKSIVAEDRKTIAALQKKPSFLHRVASVAKDVGIGIGIGFVLGVIR